MESTASEGEAKAVLPVTSARLLSSRPRCVTEGSYVAGNTPKDATGTVPIKREDMFRAAQVDRGTTSNDCVAPKAARALRLAVSGGAVRSIAEEFNLWQASIIDRRCSVEKGN